MNVIIFIGFIIFTVAIATILQQRFLKKISVNYIALGIGILIALVPQTNALIESFHSEVFMGLIVAPLLFYEGQRTRMYNVLRSWRAIVGLTVIMIILATIAAAFGIYFSLGLSLPLAFILAAISTPTDATATESVTHGLKLPKKVAFYLKDESLFNDASGIILLNMAVDWYIHRELHVEEAICNFIYSAGGGIILGGLIAILLVFLRQLNFRSKYHLTTAVSMPVEVLFFLTPFMIYFLAEEIHVSGIIAVVAAGLMHNVESERSRLSNPTIFYNSSQFSKLIIDVLNGIVFLLLGIIIVRSMRDDVFNQQTVDAIWAGLILYSANLLIRFLYCRFSPNIVGKINSKDALIFSLGGIHGAVTFALAYTLSEMSVNLADFHLILVSEITLILTSMIVPTIAFRFLLKKDKPDLEMRREVDRVRQEMVQYALKQMNEIYLPKKIRKQLKFDLRTQMNQTSIKDFIKETKYTIRQKELTENQREFRAEVYRYAFRQERNYLGRIAQQEQEYRRGFLTLYREILIAEVIFLGDTEE
ncbi:sodium:proton antiporter [Lactobacillus kefiranofaciens subsp. kefirgranum]|uniref:cation:proton antiporter n=1 Tax=Lactobacillus kefiranofaciens TaxID=267818 RepID=UPI0006F10BE4|nr:sodium:proton antiporter [Lactobacillus kefiranofaciens]KRL24496.1 Na+ H+ antiporter [Lactobacillus kefiranofaciens subsp. kefirgranum DSM 10550 = JCM 8572]MCJ2172098.1 sodium:proton antiporter [Lactobacillus kefiranofaciens]MCP9329943.1 cation:proton antiporter [Lactobacillus kefiranofaciens]PAK98909.1 sodium:proton antiporter [Lactobacillus kefiranofaciens]QNT43362.1 cation:proton antiporter [Lactobacillus kefiranofaciens]